MNLSLTDLLRARGTALSMALAASLSVASPAFARDWAWLEAACAAFDARELAEIEETGAPPSVEPAHLPAIEAMIAAWRACRGAALVEAMGSFDADPRAHAQGERSRGGTNPIARAELGSTAASVHHGRPN